MSTDWILMYIIITSLSGSGPKEIESGSVEFANKVACEAVKQEMLDQKPNSIWEEFRLIKADCYPKFVAE